MRSQEFISGFLFLATSLLFFFFSWELPKGQGNAFGPAYWPQFILAGWILLSILLILKGFFSSTKRVSFSLTDLRRKKLLLICVLIPLYLALWTFFNFFMPTVLFLFALMMILNPQKPVRLFFYSLVIAFALYSSFYWGMRIPLY